MWLFATPDGGSFAAKRGPEAEREGAVLRRLGEFRPFVPGVAAVTKDGWLVTTRLAGRDLAARFAEAGPEERERLAGAFGRALAAIHAWMPDGFARPEPGAWTAALLARCRENVRAGRVAAGTRAWRCSRFADREPADLLRDVEGAADSFIATEELVFGHGDWCLPNALSEDSLSVSGAIDWADGGWQDRRWDLATGLWALRYNASGDPHLPDYLAAFLVGYGARPDLLQQRGMVLAEMTYLLA